MQTIYPPIGDKKPYVGILILFHDPIGNRNIFISNFSIFYPLNSLSRNLVLDTRNIHAILKPMVTCLRKTTQSRVMFSPIQARTTLLFQLEEKLAKCFIDDFIG